jgi:hypothetical protein
MDKVLLDHFSDDPNISFPSQKEGSSPERPGISPNKNLRNGSLMPGGRERWGATSGQQILRRLTYLKKKTKSLRD